jgi:tRNA dimethylallyltransferase
MIKNGLLHEAENLISTKNKLVLNTVGFKEFVPYFKKEVTLEAAISEVKKNSRRYAKRQVTWFNRYNDAYLIPFGTAEKMTSLVLDKLRAPQN